MLDNQCMCCVFFFSTIDSVLYSNTIELYRPQIELKCIGLRNSASKQGVQFMRSLWGEGGLLWLGTGYGEGSPLVK